MHPQEEEISQSAKGKKDKPAQAGLWQREWKSAEGLAEDVRYYGKWMRDEAEKRIGNLYPKVKITAEMLTEREDLRKQGLKAGDELTVIAWLWARTVKCPNPACQSVIPLTRSFQPSETKFDKAYIWALAWYEQYGHEVGPYCVAEMLSKAKNTSVEGLAIRVPRSPRRQGAPAAP